MLLAAGILLYSPIAVRYFQLPSIYNNPFIRMLEFLIGILLSALFHEMKDCRFVKAVLFLKRTIALECVLLITVVSLLYYHGIGRGNYLLYSWICLPIFMVMIPGLAGASFPKLQTSKLLCYASKITYAFFLSQLLLYPIMRKWFAFVGINNNIFKIVSSFLCCSCMAVVLHEAVEVLLEKIAQKWKCLIK